MHAQETTTITAKSVSGTVLILVSEFNAKINEVIDIQQIEEVMKLLLINHGK